MSMSGQQPEMPYKHTSYEQTNTNHCPTGPKYHNTEYVGNQIWDRNNGLGYILHIWVPGPFGMVTTQHMKAPWLKGTGH